MLKKIRAHFGIKTGLAVAAVAAGLYFGGIAVGVALLGIFAVGRLIVGLRKAQPVEQRTQSPLVLQKQNAFFVQGLSSQNYMTPGLMQKLENLQSGNAEEYAMPGLEHA